MFVCHPPDRGGYWSEVEITDEMSRFWQDTILRLRVHPFAALNTDTTSYESHVLTLEPTAKARYVEYYNHLADTRKRSDSLVKKFVSKAQVAVARIALPLHGFWSMHKDASMVSGVDRITMEGAIAIMKWELAEQLRVFGLANKQHEKQHTINWLAEMKSAANHDGVGKARSIYHKKSMSRDDFRREIQPLIDQGLVEWANTRMTLYRIKEGK
jgi:hypothetical protein